MPQMPSIGRIVHAWWPNHPDPERSKPNAAIVISVDELMGTTAVGLQVFRRDGTITHVRCALHYDPANTPTVAAVWDWPPRVP